MGLLKYRNNLIYFLARFLPNIFVKDAKPITVCFGCLQLILFDLDHPSRSDLCDAGGSMQAARYLTSIL